MLWVKAFHIVLVTSWFAGLFYLPRIFVNLAMEPTGPAHDRLVIMARKLLRFTTILAVPAVLLGFWLFLGYGIGLRGPGNGWLHAKLLLVVLVIAYHVTCGLLLARLADGTNRYSSLWFRWFNEAPVLLLLGIVLLVVLKPF
jgi:putative membrane protein